MTVSVDEVQAFRRDLETFRQQSADGELSEAELEAVAGGFFLPFLTNTMDAGVRGLSSLGLAGAAVGRSLFGGKS